MATINLTLTCLEQVDGLAAAVQCGGLAGILLLQLLVAGLQHCDLLLQRLQQAPLLLGRHLGGRGRRGAAVAAGVRCQPHERHSVDHKEHQAHAHMPQPQH